MVKGYAIIKLLKINKVNQTILPYFISIEDKMIYSFNEETTEIQSYPTNSPVGAAVLMDDERILSAEKDAFI